jgi:hypothetical protein
VNAGCTAWTGTEQAAKITAKGNDMTGKIATENSVDAGVSTRESGSPIEPIVEAVHLSASHTFSKPSAESIRLLPGLGVEGDAHNGTTVKHRSRVARDPSQPNLRQVHLIHAELHDALNTQGFCVRPGDMGENITTRGIDLLGLPTGTRLQMGEAVIEITGLRNPCAQLDTFQPGLMAAVLDRNSEGNLIRKAGVMAIVIAGGEVRPADPIRITLPAEPHKPLEVV